MRIRDWTRLNHEAVSRLQTPETGAISKATHTEAHISEDLVHANVNHINFKIPRIDTCCFELNLERQHEYEKNKLSWSE